MPRYSHVRRKIPRPPDARSLSLRFVLKPYADGRQPIALDVFAARPGTVSQTEEYPAGQIPSFHAIPQAVCGAESDILNDQARTWGADCIVVGAVGCSTAGEHARLGSVATALVTRAPCSTEVVRVREPQITTNPAILSVLQRRPEAGVAGSNGPSLIDPVI